MVPSPWKVIMSRKRAPVGWLGSLQLTPFALTVHTPWIVAIVSPWIVGVVSCGGSALHSIEVLAARPRVIASICVLSFIFYSFGLFGFACSGLLCLLIVSCHFKPFT